jgi:hypothetical protein
MTHGNKGKAKSDKSKASGKKSSAKEAKSSAAGKKVAAKSSKAGKKGSTKTKGSAKAKGGSKAAGSGKEKARILPGDIEFTNPIVAAAFKQAVKKYANAFRKLTD